MIMSILPGSLINVEIGAMCDTVGHENIPALKNVVGEVDSFGYENHHMCQECYDACLAAPDPMANGSCEWCKKESTNLAPTRDYDEGSSGPVYYVCQQCRIKQDRDAQDELDRCANDSE